MRIAILATGDEIIQGDTLNTNTHHIAHLLNSEGFTMGTHMTCGDKESDILEGFAFLSKEHDVIISIGGLGPTSDDRTRFALASFLNQPLVEIKEATKHIKLRLKKGDEALDPGNYQQALFPEGVELLPNPNGSALGCYYKNKEKLYFLLPGPPRECLPMFENFAFLKIKQFKPDAKQLLKWRLFGVAEGMIAQSLDASLAHLDCQTGYRLDIPYLEFKVRCRPEQIETVKKIVEPIVEPYIIATPELKASEKLCQFIKAFDEPIVILDDATGGVLQSIIYKPETYKNLFFHDIPRARLHFHITGLQEYWQEKEAKKSQLVIKYMNETGEGKETHELVYYSPLILQVAAELICFRLLHLIEQLHN